MRSESGEEATERALTAACPHGTDTGEGRMGKDAGRPEREASEGEVSVGSSDRSSVIQRPLASLNPKETPMATSRGPEPLETHADDPFQPLLRAYEDFQPFPKEQGSGFPWASRER